MKQCLLKDPYLNLAIEDWLQLGNGVGGKHGLFLYRNKPCVVIGRNQNPWTECNTRMLSKPTLNRSSSNHTMNPHKTSITTTSPSYSSHSSNTRLPLLVRRRSGGGTVWHDLGNSNYSISMPRAEFHRSIAVKLITQALHQLDIPAKINERYDIVVPERRPSSSPSSHTSTGSDLKISGSAYKIVKDTAYHHGTMLIDTDLTSTISAYLHTPLRSSSTNNSTHTANTTTTITSRIVSKGVTSVKSEVGRLRDYSYTVDHDSFVDAVVKEFQRAYGHLYGGSGGGVGGGSGNDVMEPRYIDEKDVESVDHVQKLYEELKSADWIYRQTPPFTHTLEPPEFDMGTLEARIESVQVDESKTRLSDPFEHGPFLLELCRELVGCDYKSEAILEVMKRLSANGLSIPLTTDLNMLKEYISSEIE